MTLDNLIQLIRSESTDQCIAALENSGFNLLSTASDITSILDVVVETDQYTLVQYVLQHAQIEVVQRFKKDKLQPIHVAALLGHEKTL